MVAGVKLQEYKVDMVVEGRKINKVFLEALTYTMKPLDIKNINLKPPQARSSKKIVHVIFIIIL